MVNFAGWEMPQQYAGVRVEQLAVRQSAGLFDVSHMGRFEVGGAGAGEFLQGVLSNDLLSLEPNRARYTLMCRPDGGILDDLVVYRTESKWLLVVNAANRGKDLEWLRERAPAGVEVRDRSEETCLVALQGPGAQRMLPAEGLVLGELPHFGLAEGTVVGVGCLVARTGYTGEDGFELFLPAERAGAVWDALLAAGATPCGLACRDVCRLEAGLRLYGADMDESTNPYEVGLDWTVKLSKGEFVGRGALQAAKAAGPRRTLVGLRCLGKAIPRHGAEVRLGDERIGVVTSGTYSFWLERSICFALVEAGRLSPGAQVEVEVRSGAVAAEVVELPFYRGSVGLRGGSGRPLAPAPGQG